MTAVDIMELIGRIEQIEGPIVREDADSAERVLAIVSLGLPDSDAAVFGGIDKTIMYRWLNRGRAYETALNTEGETPKPADEKYFKFHQQFERAKVERKSRALTTARALAVKKEDWRYFSWLLSKWDPEVFGDKASLEVKVKLSSEQGQLIAKVIRAVFDELGITDPRWQEVTSKHLALVAGESA